MSEYIVDIVEENNEFWMVLPNALLKELNWNIDDEIIWEINEETKQALLKKANSSMGSNV